MEITGIILAGGKSSRMGTDKAWVKVNDIPLIDYAINSLSPCCSKVAISANQFPSYRNLEIWNDVLPINAPMIGIYSCLKRAQTPLCFVLSCDMPYVNEQLINYLISRHQPHFDITFPCHNLYKIEPLCAVYSKSILTHLEKFITNKNFKLQNLVEEANANTINLETDYPAYQAKLFANINSPNDLNSIE